MLLALSYFFYLFAGAYACKIYSDSELVKYSLYKSSGQVVRDLSGNNYHGTNGESLHSEADDVVWTDRGAYLDGDQCIALGNPLVSENPLLLSRNFTVVTWMYLLDERGYVFGSNDNLRMTHKYDLLVSKYINTKQEITIPGGYRGKIYLDKWGMFSLIFTYFSDKGILKMAHNQNVYSESTVSGHWEDSSENDHLIGKRSSTIKGFIYEFTIYDEPLSVSVFTSNTLFVPFSPCDGRPPYLDLCIAEVQDPLLNSQSQTCLCNGNSCRSDPSDCIECECGLSCSVSSPYSCLDFESEFCSPYAFNSSSLNCDLLSCSEGFFWVYNSCSSSCPSRWFANLSTRRCEECDQRCLECEGNASYCSSCPDTNSFPSEGTCLCSNGFFAVASDPLQCCSKTCTTCDGNSSCTQCNQNASLENGNCVCDSGYFLNSSFDCEKCGSYCSECEEAGCSKCENTFTLENKECVCKGEMYENECLGYFSISAMLKDDRHIELESQERLILTKDLVRLEARPYNNTVDFKINSEDSLAFKIEFEILENFLEGEYSLDLILDENIKSLENNILLTNNFSFAYEFSVDRSLSSREERTVLGFISTLFTNFVAMITLDEPTALWTISRTVQYISYLPLLDIAISDSFYRFLRTYNTALFVPNLGVKYIERTETIASERFQKFGVLNKEFEDTNVLRNSARFLELFAGMFCVTLFVCAMSYVLPYSFVKKKRDMFRRKVLGCLIRLWILLGLDFLMYSSVTLFSDNKSLLSFSVMNTIFLIGNLSPMVFYLLIVKNEEGLRSKDEKTMNYLDSFVEGIRLESNHGIFYEVFIGIRNLVYVYTVCWIWGYPIVFCGIQLVVSVSFFLLMIRYKLFKTNTFLATNVLSEVCLSVLFIGLIAIKELESEDGRILIEYTMEGVCVAFILFATFASIVVTVAKKFKGKKNKGDHLPVSKVQPFDNENYENNSFQQQLFHFIEPGSMSVINISRSRDND